MLSSDQNSGRTPNPVGRSANAETLRRISEFVFADFPGSSKDAYIRILFNLLSNAPNNQRVPWPFAWEIGEDDPVGDILRTKDAWPKIGRQVTAVLRLKSKEEALRDHLYKESVRVAAVQDAEACKEIADRLLAESMIAARIAEEAKEAEEAGVPPSP